MTVKLLTEQHLEFQSLKGGCTSLSESTLVKMPHCWKSHFMAHFVIIFSSTLNRDMTSTAVSDCQKPGSWDACLHCYEPR